MIACWLWQNYNTSNLFSGLYSSYFVSISTAFIFCFWRRFNICMSHTSMSQNEISVKSLWVVFANSQNRESKYFLYTTTALAENLINRPSFLGLFLLLFFFFSFLSRHPYGWWSRNIATTNYTAQSATTHRALLCHCLDWVYYCQLFSKNVYSSSGRANKLL